MNAVCVRCGAAKDHYAHVCPSCGNRPDGDGLLVAWIASREHLGPEALEAVAARIEKGEPLRPSPAMLDKARKALGRAIATDVGLTVAQRAAIMVCSVLATPLVGLTCFMWWRTERPRAAWQALAMSLPFSVLFTGMWLWAILGGVA